LCFFCFANAGTSSLSETLNLKLVLFMLNRILDLRSFLAISISIAACGVLGVGAASAATITFKQGETGYTGASNTSYKYDGSSPSTEIRIDRPDTTQPTGSYAVLRFDDIIGVGGITAGSVISSARLEGVVTNTFEAAIVARLLQDEASRPLGPARLDDAGVAGSFYDDSTDVLATHADNCGDNCVPPQPISWDVTELVQAWVNGEPNYGFLILPVTRNGGNLAPVGDANGPRLVVMTPTPEPHAALLFGIGTLVVGKALRRRRRA
jgi:hypothetical protein